MAVGTVVTFRWSGLGRRVLRLADSTAFTVVGLGVAASGIALSLMASSDELSEFEIEIDSSDTTELSSLSTSLLVDGAALISVSAVVASTTSLRTKDGGRDF